MKTILPDASGGVKVSGGWRGTSELQREGKC